LTHGGESPKHQPLSSRGIILGFFLRQVLQLCDLKSYSAATSPFAPGIGRYRGRRWPTGRLRGWARTAASKKSLTASSLHRSRHNLRIAPGGEGRSSSDAVGHCDWIHRHNRSSISQSNLSRVLTLPVENLWRAPDFRTSAQPLHVQCCFLPTSLQSQPHRYRSPIRGVGSHQGSLRTQYARKGPCRELLQFSGRVPVHVTAKIYSSDASADPGGTVRNA